eukprot:CAMPEP_0177624020 /NCGR_PEP_ID=MMETSP0419_2-20121207/29239_1 /TAXON_ID=582737 /ORGANISM="Tetraselmis sp., Strain GSL018" /LENGTH=341 /DNA_ID=CAMNT_0019124663 /DNA_START=1202 /DNA_END=2224 /DNA_ORIENTATION=-
MATASCKARARENVEPTRGAAKPSACDRAEQGIRPRLLAGGHVLVEHDTCPGVDHRLPRRAVGESDAGHARSQCAGQTGRRGAPRPRPSADAPDRRHAHQAADRPVPERLDLALPPHAGVLHLMVSYKLQRAEAVAVCWAEDSAVLRQRSKSLLGALKLDECHATWPPIRLQDNADPVGLDQVTSEELPYLMQGRLVRDALHFQDAVPTEAEVQSILHLPPPHAEQLHKPVAELGAELRAVLGGDGTGRLLGRLKVHETLSCWAVETCRDNLNAIGTEVEPIEKMYQVDLLSLKGKALDFDDCFVVYPSCPIVQRIPVTRNRYVGHVGMICLCRRVYSNKP